MVCRLAALSSLMSTRQPRCSITLCPVNRVSQTQGLGFADEMGGCLCLANRLPSRIIVQDTDHPSLVWTSCLIIMRLGYLAYHAGVVYVVIFPGSADR